jgi:hypothetical protein
VSEKTLDATTTSYAVDHQLGQDPNSKFDL